MIIIAACCAIACSKKSESDAGTKTNGSAGASQANAGTTSGSGTGGMSSSASSSGAGGGSAGRPTLPAASTGGPGANGASGVAMDGSATGGAPEDDSGVETDGGLPRAMMPIDPPVADDCIDDVTAGDKTYTCNGLTFLALIDPMCTRFACGLIFDIHGATMSGAQMRDNTLLYKIAPPEGYIVVNPSATSANTGGTWDLTNDPPNVYDFMARTIKAFHVDPDRVHVTGFSQGSAMTFWFLCNHHDLLASAAPVSGATDVSCLDDGWQPRVPILYENGTKDQASTIDTARMMVDSIASQLKLMGGMQIAGDDQYRRKHWAGDGGMEFDYIEHDYGGQPVLDGHCIPGGVDTPTGGMNNFSLNATTCTTGNITINWGELALQWFLDHPRKQ